MPSSSKPRRTAATLASPDVLIELVALSHTEDGEWLVALRAAPELGLGLPWRRVSPSTPDALVGPRASLFAQVGARPGAWSADLTLRVGTSHPTGVPLRFAVVTVVAPEHREAGVEWVRPTARRGLTPEDKALVREAIQRVRLGRSEDVAFSMVPSRFTLPGLQLACSALVGRPLTKAAFRRGILTRPGLVKTTAMHSVGRGRPAALYRFIPDQRTESTRTSYAHL